MWPQIPSRRTRNVAARRQWAGNQAERDASEGPAAAAIRAQLAKFGVKWAAPDTMVAWHTARISSGASEREFPDTQAGQLLSSNSTAWMVYRFQSWMPHESRLFHEVIGHGEAFLRPHPANAIPQGSAVHACGRKRKLVVDCDVRLRRITGLNEFPIRRSDSTSSKPERPGIARSFTTADREACARQPGGRLRASPSAEIETGARYWPAAIFLLLLLSVSCAQDAIIEAHV